MILKTYRLPLSSIDATHPLEAAIAKKYADHPEIAGVPLVATFVLTGTEGDYLVLIFQKL